MIKSIIELTDLIQKYKQEVFWESEKLKKKFNVFYKKQSKDNLGILSDYKTNGHIDINTFLFDRKIFFSENPRSLFEILDIIYKNNKKFDKQKIKMELLNYIYVIIYNIIKNIIELDKFFIKAPNTDDDVIVYRGMKFANKIIEEKITKSLTKLKKGDTYIFKNYLSTSLLNETALNFLESHFTEDKDPKCCLIKIIIPKHTKILYLDTNLIINYRIKLREANRNRDEKLLINASEYEILLPRGSLLKFINSYTISGKMPHSCKINEIKKGHISDILVYEFEMVGIDPKRELFSLNKIKDSEYIEKIIKDIIDIQFYVSKYQLLYQLKTKNFSSVIKKYKNRYKDRSD